MRVNPIVERAEVRWPAEIKVRLAGHPLIAGVETATTENVSLHGARVRSVLAWQTNQVVVIASVGGTLHSTARVVYCQRQPARDFCIGLELLEPSGEWIPTAPEQFARQTGA